MLLPSDLKRQIKYTKAKVVDLKRPNSFGIILWKSYTLPSKQILIHHNLFYEIFFLEKSIIIYCLLLIKIRQNHFITFKACLDFYFILLPPWLCRVTYFIFCFWLVLRLSKSHFVNLWTISNRQILYQISLSTSLRFPQR